MRMTAFSCTLHKIISEFVRIPMTLEGHFSRKEIDAPHSPTRYPARIVVEYDTTDLDPSLTSSLGFDVEPDIIFTAGASKLVAEYEFDCGLGYFEFKGWSLREPRRHDDS